MHQKASSVTVRQVVPILRAGLVLLEQATTVLPASETYHVGYVRDESTLKAREYLNKLPASLDAEDRILITDPMLATGACPLLGLQLPSAVASYAGCLLSQGREKPCCAWYFAGAAARASQGHVPA